MTGLSSSQAVLYEGEHTVKAFSDFLESQIQTRPEAGDEVGETAVPALFSPRSQRTRRAGVRTSSGDS